MTLHVHDHKLSTNKVNSRFGCQQQKHRGPIMAIKLLHPGQSFGALVFALLGKVLNTHAALSTLRRLNTLQRTRTCIALPSASEQRPGRNSFV